MLRPRNSTDRTFLISVIVLVFVGFLIFSSASLGLLARNGATFTSVALGQIFLGIIGGFIGLLFATRIHYRIYRRYAPYIFLISLGITLLVFVPGIGFSYGGATRWINIGFTTFQPAELLKLGFVIYLASFLSSLKEKLYSWKQGILPFVGLLSLPSIILLLQPDTGTVLVIFSTALAMFVAAGARVRDIVGLGVLSVGAFAVVASVRPYVMDRLLTFLNPALDPLGSGYQIQQALIAIGSGQMFGRGFGQSVQKFNYLPEPIGDSIFAVFAEEFGFIGVTFLISLFIFFTLRGMRIASRAPDKFGGLIVVGIVILITSQSFINIGSLVGIFPLTGLPLLFVSHGGSALFLALIGVGIILNVSRYATKNKISS